MADLTGFSGPFSHTGLVPFGANGASTLYPGTGLFPSQVAGFENMSGRFSFRLLFRSLLRFKQIVGHSASLHSQSFGNFSMGLILCFEIEHSLLLVRCHYPRTPQRAMAGLRWPINVGTLWDNNVGIFCS